MNYKDGTGIDVKTEINEAVFSQKSAVVDEFELTETTPCTIKLDETKCCGSEQKNGAQTPANFLPVNKQQLSNIEASATVKVCNDNEKIENPNKKQNTIDSGQQTEHERNFKSGHNEFSSNGNDSSETSETEHDMFSDTGISNIQLGHGKVFKLPFFRQNDNSVTAHTIGSHYQRENQSQQKKKNNMTHGTKSKSDKRFSLFSDREYVTMTSLASFEKLCNKHADENKDLSQEDYLKMDHPIVSNSSLFFPPEDLFKVQLRKRSKSQLPSDRLVRSNGDNRISNRFPHQTGSGNKRDRSKSRRAYDTNTKSIGDLSQLLDVNVNLFQKQDNESINLLRNNNNKKNTSDSNDDIDNKRSSSNNNNNKSVLYDRLMDDVNKIMEKNGGQNIDEDDLIGFEKFNRFESRLIFHSMQGWTPRLAAPSKISSMTSSSENFVEDYTVNELYLFIRSLGNSKLAEYLRMYSVDGFLLMNIVRDDLLLDRMLFDDSFLTVEELVKLRLAIFPKRPRCNALEGGTSKQHIVNII